MSNEFPRVFDELSKYNPYHDNKGKFTSGGNAHANVPMGGVGAHTTQYGMEFKWARPTADDVHAKAKAAEPEITRAMKGIEGDGATLVGLEYAVKGKDSLTRKIVTDAAKERVSYGVAGGNIKDSVRYTLQVNEANYAGKVTSALSQLEAQGYKVTNFKNTWGKEPMLYQGINCNLKTPQGLTIELQFHTPTSFYTKEKLNHKPYEEARLPKTSPKRVAELEEIMRNNQKKVPHHHGMTELKWGV